MVRQSDNSGAEYYRKSVVLRPFWWSAVDRRIDLEGVVTVSGDGPKGVHAYTQLFRSGVIEGVHVFRNVDGDVVIPSRAYEANLMRANSGYLAQLAQLGIEPPIYVFLSFAGVRRRRFGDSTSISWGQRPPALSGDTLILPEVVVIHDDIDPHRVLRPIFNAVWISFGFECSFNYDAQGNWKGLV